MRTLVRRADVIRTWLGHPWWFFLLLFCAPVRVEAQCTPQCIDYTLSLSQSCLDTIRPDDVWGVGTPLTCLDSFSVVLYDGNGQLVPTSPAVNEQWIGSSFEAHLIHINTGDSCVSIVSVVDEIPPVLDCVDTSIDCFSPITPDVTGYPEILDECSSNVTLSYVDNFVQNDCTQTDTIEIINRLWIAVDEGGNVDNCIQQIFIVRPPITDMDFPVDLDGQQADPLYCPNADTSPSNTGIPSFGGVPIDQVCFYQTSFIDVTVPGCAGSFTVFREWEITDDCSGATLAQTQVIEVQDTLAPVLTCVDDFEIETNNLDCTSSLVIPTPTAIDACGGVVSFSLSVPGGLVSGLTVFNLPSGTFNATLFAQDDCGNIDSCHFDITVVDVVPPVAVSVGNANISLLPTEPTFVTSVTFDDGSWDNCGPITLSARRLDSPNCPGNDGTIFGPTVPFFCCDAENTVEVEIRVMDLEGNSSTAISSVQVFDNLSPAVLCPDNMVLDCTVDYTDLSITGEATASDNCPGFTVEHQDSVILGSCGAGEVFRTWTVTDAFGRSSTCTQTITLLDQDIFFINPIDPLDVNDDVIWPENYIASGCGAAVLPDALPTLAGWPQIVTDTTCAMVSISYFDEYLNSPTNCLDLLREWTIIDFCQFDPNNGTGVWTYFQQIQIPTSEPPVFTSACDTVMACSDDVTCVTGELFFQLAATDDCTDLADLTYMYEVDIFGDGQVEIIQLGSLIEQELPLGSHLITATVSDDCGQSTSCTVTIVVEDCLAPTPVCQNQTVALSPFGTSIFAEDFNLASFDNCSSSGDIIYSFASDSLVQEIPINCQWLGEQGVVLWVSDENGNQVPCGVTLTVEDPDGLCGNGSIAGGLQTENGQGLVGAGVNIESSGGQLFQLTDQSGAYFFPDLVVGLDYVVSPILDQDWDNGVTTFDEVLITKHILGLMPLDSPYKVIAADVNNSGTITTLDVVLLKKIILLLETSVATNTSWRFVDANYEFLNPVNPLNENFPEQVVINGLAEAIEVNFVAIKVGDVNGSAMTIP